MDLIVLLSGVGFLAGAVIGYVFCLSRWHLKKQTLKSAFEVTQSQAQAELGYLRTQVGQLQQALELKEAALKEQAEYALRLSNELSGLRVRLEAEQKTSLEKHTLLEESKLQLMDAFKALSSEALKANNQSFLEVARATLATTQEAARGDLAKRQEAIEHLLRPMQETLLQFDQKVQSLEKTRVSAYSCVTEQIKALSQTQMRLERETSNLVRALRAPQVRGRWGELQLKRTVEVAGMVDYVDFCEQAHVATEDGRLRPDMLIRLPNGRTLVMDAKVPLTEYLASLEADSPEQQKEHLKQHARQVRDHLTKLGAKRYWSQFEESPEFVVLFLAGEVFFSAALEQDSGLIEYGVEQKVIIATPTTLIALLKAVAYGWKQEAMAKEARTVCDLGKTLYERLSVFTGHFNDLRKHLEKSVGSYNKMVQSVESRLLPAARKLKDMAVCTDRELEATESIDKIPTMPRTDLFITGQQQREDSPNLF